jgi:hypothetical protein
VDLHTLTLPSRLFLFTSAHSINCEILVANTGKTSSYVGLIS